MNKKQLIIVLVFSFVFCISLLLAEETIQDILAKAENVGPVQYETVNIVSITGMPHEVATTATQKIWQKLPYMRIESTISGTTKVAIVPSDYSGLSTQVSRSINPDYEQIEKMVRKAIELQGGLDGVIKKDDKVMLKINLVGGNSPSGQGENTDVRVVKALIKIIDEFTEGDVEIIVAEGTARSNDKVDEAFSVWDNSGYQDLLTDSYLSGHKTFIWQDKTVPMKAFFWKGPGKSGYRTLPQLIHRYR